MIALHFFCQLSKYLEQSRDVNAECQLRVVEKLKMCFAAFTAVEKPEMCAGSGSGQARTTTSSKIRKSLKICK